jgi:type I restriction enzyme, S subunit
MSWEVKPLEEVCNVEFGTRVVKKKDGGSIYPVYGGGGATFSMDEFNREDRLVVARFAMSEQCTRFVQGKFFLNDSGLTVRPRDSKKLALDFLNYHLLALNDEIYSLGKGTAQRNLESDAFRRLHLSIPDSLPEQQRIVGKLDAAFAALAEAQTHVERNRANARELFESYLNGVFDGVGWINNGVVGQQRIVGSISWDRKPLAAACNVEFGTRVVKKKDGGSIFPVYGGGGATFSMDDFNREDRLVVARFAMSEQCTRFVQGKFFLNDSGLTVSTKDRMLLDQGFLDYHLLALNDDIYALGKGTAQKNLESEAFRQLSLNIPSSLIEQQRIVTELDAISDKTNELEATYQQKLTELAGLKKAVLGAAFRGEL